MPDTKLTLETINSRFLARLNNELNAAYHKRAEILTKRYKDAKIECDYITHGTNPHKNSYHMTVEAIVSNSTPDNPTPEVSCRTKTDNWPAEGPSSKITRVPLFSISWLQTHINEAKAPDFMADAEYAENQKQINDLTWLLRLTKSAIHNSDQTN